MHFADVVVTITNGYYSTPAKGFALIGSRHLEEWATWGVPLSKVLEALC